MSKRGLSDTDTSNQRGPRKRRHPPLSSQAITNDAIATTPRVTGFTLRISNIPSSISEDQFLQTLNDLPHGVQSSGGQQNVLGWSFTLPVSSADAKKSRTATVTFESIPLKFKSTLASIDLFGGVIADSHFYGMTPLYHPPESQYIIAVTGLAAHAFGSWKSRGGYKMWIRDFLPKHIPNARILIYGYDSTLFNNNSHASIPQFSQNFLQAIKTARTGDVGRYRPIVFIGHSLGGLVIRHTLADAQSSLDDGGKSIISSRYALLLFGVPHKGLKVESLRSMVKGQANARLIEDLSESSNFLQVLDKLWKSTQPKNIRVISVYETKPTPTAVKTSDGWKRAGPEVLLVGRDSATAATPETMPDNIFSIDANHSDIVKFDNSICQDYLNVRSNILSLVKGLNEKSNEMEAYVSLRGSDGERKRSDILSWLSQIEYIKHHENAKEGLLEHTGRWLFKKPEFHEWLFSGSSGILWLHGTPGVGKTKLTCMVIDTIMRPPYSHNTSRFQRHAPVVYFYCNQNEPLRQDPTKILQAIIKQLSVARPYIPGLPELVVAEYDKRVREGLASGSLSFEDSHRLVISLLKLYPQTIIIIDALDECNPKERWQLLEVLTTIIKSSDPTSLVKVFISSRDDIDITLKLEDAPNLYINATENDIDIMRFVIRGVEEAVENKSLLCGQISSELQREIIDTIALKANGMFQWADLQIKHLCQMNLEEDIRGNLGKLPADLEGAYSQVYTAILSEKPHAQRITKKALMWIMCSRRLFTREEWAEATYWPKEVPGGGVLTLFKLCRNLVTWDSQSHAVRFAHLSVREYLETKLSSIDRHSMAVKFCFSVLNHTYSAVSENRKPSGPRKSLVEYATIYWPFHAGHSFDSEHHMTMDTLGLLQRFLGTPTKPGEAYCQWMKSANTLIPQTRNVLPEDGLRGPLYHLASTPLNPLFAMSFYRFGGELKAQWESNSFDINSTNNIGETLLLVAIARRNIWVVDFLLEKGADLNAGHSPYNGYIHSKNLYFSDQHFVNPLIAAIRCWDIEVLLKLLDMGASVNANGSPFTDILQAAACLGTVSVVEAIMDRGTNNMITEAVVQAAMENRHIYGNHIIQTMLARGNTTITEMAIVEIAKMGNTNIMQILLPRVINMKITEALVIAVERNRPCGRKLMKMLLASENTTVTETAIVKIFRIPNKDTVKMLLDKDTDIKTTEEMVIAAAGNRRCGQEIIQTLIARGNVTITKTAVIAAARNEKCGQKIMQLLLDRDPNIKVTNAVVAAVAENENYGPEIMRMLLARDANIKITGAVVIAAAGNEKYGQKVMKILLARDNIKITEEVTIAVARNWVRGHILMRMILARDPLIGITDAVVTAAASNQQHGYDIIEILLARNTNIKATETVMIAAVRNHEHGQRIIQALLDRDTKIEITEAIVVAAENSRLGTMGTLLDRDNINITEAAVLRIVGNSSDNMIQMLLDRNPKISITDAVMIAAVRNVRYGQEAMQILLSRDTKIEITEATLVEIAKKFDKSIIQMLRAKNPNIKVTKAKS